MRAGKNILKFLARTKLQRTKLSIVQSGLVICWPTCAAGFQWQERCGIAMAQMADLRSVAIWLYGAGGGLHITLGRFMSV